MNNTTRTLAIAAILAATLVVGTFATTTETAFAASDNNSGNTVTAQINRQGATQSGFDNTQEQEAQNTICTHPGENATCIQEGAVSAQAAVNKTQPAKSPCEQCFTSLLSQTQINKVVDLYKTHVTSLADLCRILEQTNTDVETLLFALEGAGVSETTATELVACLENAGIVFTT